MRRIVIGVVLAFFAATAFAGGRAQAPDVGAGAEDVAYISPQSSPGIQDELTIPISVGELPRNVVIVEYEFVVQNAAGDLVWVETGIDETERPGFFGRLMENLGLRARETTVRIPEQTAWDGTYSGSAIAPDGRPVPDGEYTYVLTVIDNRGVTATSEPRTVVVDNTPPVATASVDYTVFEPGGRRGSITLTQQTSVEDQWVGRITTDGELIYEVFWAGQAVEAFTWDGTNLAGLEVGEGEYTYTLTATDRAGNTGSIEPITVVVDTAPRPLDIVASTPAFSPNDSGVKDTVEFTFGRPSLLRLESAVISVTDAAGNPVGSVEIGDRIADRVVLTGYLDEAQTRRAPEGTYLVSVTATYGNGAIAEAGPIPVTLDVTPPRGSITVSDTIFSPDGDGFKDTVRISHLVDEDAYWTGYVSVPGAEVIQTLRFGRDVPPVVFWDGTDLDGDPVPDGTYAYYLYGEDLAGNRTQTNEIRVTVDRRPTLVDLRVNRRYFAPGSGGLGDVIILTPVLSVRDGIAEYSFRIMDSGGNVVLAGDGTGALPREIVWDGRRPDGAILPEGDYVGVLDLIYTKGNRPQALTPVVTIDQTVPQVSLRATTNRITPRIEGAQDSVTFIPFVHPVGEIVRFTGRVESMDGRVVAELTGTRPVGSAVWDGTTRTGQIAPDGSYVASLEVEHRNGIVRRAQTGTIALVTDEFIGPPPVALRLSPQTFSPDGDGRADTVSVTLAVGDRRPIAEWTITVRDPNGRVFYQYSGTGEPVRAYEWNGLNDAGQRVRMATDYTVEYMVTDARGNVARGSEVLTVDILTVERYGMRKIDLPDIIFEGFTTRYLNWNKDLSEQNVQVLNQIADALRKFPNYRVALHGHAVSVLYYDARLSDLEHVQTLLPLSQGRAETIRDALVSRGLAANRFSLQWWGKLRPLVPFSALDERFINRRVEFFIER